MRRMTQVSLCLLTILTVSTLVFPQSDAPKQISGGILNGKAVDLPKPEYPEDWRVSGIKGIVEIAVTIDEQGDVISAEPVFDSMKRPVLDRKPRPDSNDTEKYIVSTPETPNPLLVESARKAAMNAKFSPTLLSGVPVRVTGVIIYNFSASKTESLPNARSISGGVLNGKATILPKPAFPPAAAAVRAEGAVTVQVLIDEEGNVISAQAVSGHPLLRAAAVTAAREAKFNPTFLSGEPVKVSGVLTYNFVLPKREDNLQVSDY